MERMSPIQLREQQEPVDIKGLQKLHVRAFATLGCKEIRDPLKLHIRQLYLAPQQEHSPHGQHSSDTQLEVYSYLENLQSICFPETPSLKVIQLKQLSSKQNTGSSPQTKKNKELKIDQDSFLAMKEHKIGTYTITTSLGIKRYLTYLTCREPTYGSSSPATQPNEIVLQPFAYVIVQDEPAFKFSRNILKGLYETNIVPYYKMLQVSIGKQETKQQLQMSQFPLRLEFILSYLFGIINHNSDSILVKKIEDFRDSETPIIFEEDLNYEDGIPFQKSNVSLTYLFQTIAVPQVIQLLNCILLQKKVILISSDSMKNGLIIEALLELISPIMSKDILLNISYLKIEMIDYIDSPVPFIIGVEEAIWIQVFIRKWPELSDDTLYYAIESELLNSKIDLPSPSEPMTALLQQSMTDLLQRQPQLSERELGLYMKQAVFNYFLLLINDFRQFKVNFTGQEEKELSPIGFSKVIGLNQLFKFKLYLESQTQENNEFYTAFVDTQLFNDFIERALRTNQDPSLTYFIKCLDILQVKQSLIDVVDHQQGIINRILNALKDKEVTFQLEDLIESYEKFLPNDKQVHIKRLQNNGIQEAGIFSFDQDLICTHLQKEHQKLLQVKSLIKKPTPSRKIKPSKKSDNNLYKQSFVVAGQVNNESRNLSSSIKESQQILSSVYFQKGPQKVSTPKGLPSELKSMGNFLSEDDSKSTNSKDNRNSQEETKSETSSIKSFFKFTLEKIQSKLKNNKNEAINSAGTTPLKNPSLLIDVRQIIMSGFTAFTQINKPPNSNLKSSESFKFYNQQRALFSSAFGPKSEFSYGRPKCYSESTASQIKGAISSAQIPSNFHYMVDIKNNDARPSAISISNRSNQESPKSLEVSTDLLEANQKRRSELLTTSQSSLIQLPLSSRETYIRSSTQKDNHHNTSSFSTHISNVGGSKQQSQHQLSYPIVASGMVIVKDLNSNTKRVVKNININLDRDDDRLKKLKIKQSNSSLVQPSSMNQSLSNSQLLSINQQTPQMKTTLNSSRSNQASAVSYTSMKQTIGSESPSDSIFSQIQKSSEKKAKNTSFKVPSGGSSAGKSNTSRAKAISLNQPIQIDTKKTSIQCLNPSQQPQLKGAQVQQKSGKNSMKMKRDTELVKLVVQNQQVTLRRNTDKGSQITSQRGDKQQVTIGLLSAPDVGHSSNPTQKSASKLSKNGSPTGLNDDLDGFQSRMRSISYQMNQQEFQSNIKVKMTKQQSTKNLLAKSSPSNEREVQSLNKSKTIQSSKTQSKVGDQMLLLQPKSHLQTFNEFQSSSIIGGGSPCNLHEYDDGESDCQAVDTPHQQMEEPHTGFIVQSMNAAVGYNNNNNILNQ